MLWRMMRHAVVAFPVMSDADSVWIESLRAKHDPQAAFIRAHFTLLFPVADPAAIVIAEAVQAASRQSRFVVELTRAIAHRGPDERSSYVFLLPSRGGHAIVRMHEAMYRGELSRHLNLALPYVPHVTVCRSDDHDVCDGLADRLNGKGVSICATVAAVDVVALGETAISVETIALTG
jgi:2'-5' RNA ligase